MNIYSWKCLSCRFAMHSHHHHHHANLSNSSIKQVNCVGGMAGIEPTPSKSNDWTPLSPCQLSQGGRLSQQLTSHAAHRALTVHAVRHARRSPHTQLTAHAAHSACRSLHSQLATHVEHKTPQRRRSPCTPLTAHAAHRQQRTQQLTARSTRTPRTQPAKNTARWACSSQHTQLARCKAT